MWEPRRLTTLWSSTACYRDNFKLVYPLPRHLSNWVQIFCILENKIIKSCKLKPAILLYYIQDVPASKLGCTAENSLRSSSSISSAPRKMCGHFMKLGHDRFFRLHLYSCFTKQHSDSRYKMPVTYSLTYLRS
jgi:hypothetical protein